MYQKPYLQTYRRKIGDRSLKIHELIEHLRQFDQMASVEGNLIQFLEGTPVRLTEIGIVTYPQKNVVVLSWELY